jgi:hypothetical protein
MDPDTCLFEILKSLSDHYNHKPSDEPEDIADRMRDLADWIEKGGWLPKVQAGNGVGFMIA